MLCTKTLLVTNFPFKTGLDYEIKQLSKEVLQFTKVFAIYFIFKFSKDVRNYQILKKRNRIIVILHQLWH